MPNPTFAREVLACLSRYREEHSRLDLDLDETLSAQHFMHYCDPLGMDRCMLLPHAADILLGISVELLNPKQLMNVAQLFDGEDCLTRLSSYMTQKNLINLVHQQNMNENQAITLISGDELLYRHYLRVVKVNYNLRSTSANEEKESTDKKVKNID